MLRAKSVVIFSKNDMLDFYGYKHLLSELLVRCREVTQAQHEDYVAKLCESAQQDGIVQQEIEDRGTHLYNIYPHQV